MAARTTCWSCRSYTTKIISPGLLNFDPPSGLPFVILPKSATGPVELK
jgi:hypothetical protein